MKYIVVLIVKIDAQFSTLRTLKMVIATILTRCDAKRVKYIRACPRTTSHGIINPTGFSLDSQTICACSKGIPHYNLVGGKRISVQ